MFLSLAYRDAKPDGVDITAAGELGFRTLSLLWNGDVFHMWGYLCHQFTF